MSNCIVNLTLLKKDKPNIGMSHPAFRVLSQRAAPKRFHKRVCRGLPPRQCPQGCNDQKCTGYNDGAVLRKLARQSNNACARKRNGTDARQILVMVCHERIPKREQHDQSEYWAKRGDVKCGRDLNASPEVSPEKIDDHARRDTR